MPNLVKLLMNKRLLLGVTILGCIILCTIGPLRFLFDHDFLVHYLQMYGYGAVIIFLIAYILLTIIGIPGTLLTVAGGYVFGLSWGTFWSVLGATLGAMGAFWTARYLLHDWIKHRFGHHPTLARFNQAVTHRPLAFVLAVRFAPISPFNVVNFLFGLTPIQWLPYFIGTFIGIIPGTLAYTWLGVSGLEALEGGEILPFLLALGLLSLLSIMPFLVRFSQKRWHH